MSSFERKLIDKEKDRIGEDNSQLIHQVAGSVQGLQSEVNTLPTQSDLNAKISDTVYSQTDWNGVTTIGASKNALSDKLELLLSQSDFNAATMIGSGNAANIPCIYSGHSTTTYKVYRDTLGIHNIDGTNFSLFFTCPLPTNRGGKKLYVGDVIVDLSDADADDKIIYLFVRGYDYDSAATINDSAAERTAPGSYTYDFTPADASAYKIVVIQFNVEANNAADFDLRSVVLECYYDT